MKVAGLSVVDRLVIAAHRAGCAPIILVSETAPPLPQSEELKIFSARVLATAPEFDEPALLISGPVLVEARDLERVIARRGRLVSSSGSSLPVQMNTLEPPAVTAEGVAIAVPDEDAARVAERQLWASLRTSADGVVDRFFNRPVGRLLSKILVQTEVSPNQVSICASLIGLVSACLFADARFLAGAIVLQFSAIIDCVDGDLARVRLQQSEFGKWLDLVGDQVVHFSVFFGIGLGVMRTGSGTPALSLGMSAAVGVLISFAVIVRASSRAKNNSRVEKLIDATTNRDFSVLLLILAFVGKIDLFLWLAGLGVHLFWMTVLVLQFSRDRADLTKVPREST